MATAFCVSTSLRMAYLRRANSLWAALRRITLPPASDNPEGPRAFLSLPVPPQQFPAECCSCGGEGEEQALLPHQSDGCHCADMCSCARYLRCGRLEVDGDSKVYNEGAALG
eukprot:752537-Hanusia_phi.AAC.2